MSTSHAISSGTGAACSAVDEHIEPAQVQSRALQEQLQQIQEHIRSLRSTRNTLVPISHLPFELLSRIFEFYIHGAELRVSQNGLPDYDSSDPFANIQWGDIMRIMSVCRTWRTTALECQGFWSRIICLQPYTHISEEMLSTMLSRSKASQIHVRVSSSLASDDYAYRIGIGSYETVPIATLPRLRHRLMDIQRMRELHLELRVYQLRCLLRAIQPPPTQGAKHLQSVCIRSSDPRPGEEIAEEMEKLLLYQMPSLQYLEITKHAVNWAALRDAAARSSFPNLVSLKLAPLDRQPTKEQLYGILVETPHLTNLFLEGALPETPSTSEANCRGISQIVQLPYLSSCSIKSSSISQCVDFHSNVSYPTTRAKFHLHASGHNERFYPPAAASAVLELLRTIGLSSDNHTRTHSNLFMTMPATVPLILALWDDNVGTSPKKFEEFEFGRRTPAVLLDFTESRVEYNIELLFQISISGLINVGIRCVIDAPRMWYWRKWLCFFDRHQDITHLHLHADRIADWLIVLSTPIVDRGDEGEEFHDPSSALAGIPHSTEPRSRLCLPNLTTLVLQDHGLLSGAQVVVTDMLIEAEKLVDCLIKRCNHGLQIQEIHFAPGYGWNERSYKLLTEVAVSVTWAGLVPPYDNGLEDDSEDEDYVEGEEVDSDERNSESWDGSECGSES